MKAGRPRKTVIVESKKLDETTSDLNKVLEESITLNIDTSLKESKQFFNNRDKFIKDIKNNFLSKFSNPLDALHILLVEKIAIILFEYEYLCRKFPNDVIIAGSSSINNQFVIELEFIKTMLVHQMTFLGNALGIMEKNLHANYSPKPAAVVGKKIIED